MQALLSFENSPPISAPFRFFLTAPLFLVLVGVLMLHQGEASLSSRWAPSTLALTHLVTIGFMLQVMLGALIQILPVLAGANFATPLPTACWVHAALTTGGLALVAGFLMHSTMLLELAVPLLGGGLGGFLIAVIFAFRGVPSTSPTIRGLKLAMIGLGGVLVSGGVLAFALTRGWGIPLLPAVDIHAAWGLGAWSGVLLAAVSYVVVPMFQLTPGYPASPSWWFPVLVLAGVAFWAAAALLGWDDLLRCSQGGLAILGICFALKTLSLQAQRRRARSDVSYRYWQLGSLASCGALGMLLIAALYPDVTDWPQWSLIFGILMIGGGFLPFMIGMLFKIVPFLTWLHLQHESQGKVAMPAMHKILPEAGLNRQFQLYVIALVMLLLAVFFPETLTRFAALCILATSLKLCLCLWRGVQFYRHHQPGSEVKVAS